MYMLRISGVWILKSLKTPYLQTKSQCSNVVNDPIASGVDIDSPHKVLSIEQEYSCVKLLEWVCCQHLGLVEMAF